MVQDAQELLRYALEAIHADVVPSVPTNAGKTKAEERTSVVTDVFGGSLWNEVRVSTGECKCEGADNGNGNGEDEDELMAAGLGVVDGMSFAGDLPGVQDGLVQGRPVPR